MPPLAAPTSSNPRQAALFYGAPVVPVCVFLQSLVRVVQVDVQSTDDVEELQGMLGLALQLDTYGREGPSAPPLHVPCQAPFTSMLPDTMRLAHRSLHL